jgi:hypothetical protein
MNALAKPSVCRRGDRNFDLVVSVATGLKTKSVGRFLRSNVESGQPPLVLSGAVVDDGLSGKVDFHVLEQKDCDESRLSNVTI